MRKALGCGHRYPMPAFRDQMVAHLLAIGAAILNASPALSAKVQIMVEVCSGAGGAVQIPIKQKDPEQNMCGKACHAFCDRRYGGRADGGCRTTTA